MKIDDLMTVVNDGRPIFGRDDFDPEFCHAALVLRRLIPAVKKGVEDLARHDVPATEMEVDWYVWRLTRGVDGLWSYSKSSVQHMKFLGLDCYVQARHALNRSEKVRIFSSPLYGCFVDSKLDPEPICPRCGCLEHEGDCD